MAGLVKNYAFQKGLEGDQKLLVKINWENAGTFERDSPLITQFSELLNLSKEKVDELFINAKKL